MDKNEPFYIGIGQTVGFRRAYNKYRRNTHWKNIIANTEYEVEILFSDLTEEEAIKKEIEFIALYGRADLGKGSLCNMTNGGDRAFGIICSEEKKKRLSEINRKYKHTPEAKEKIRKAASNISEETRQKMSISRKGKKRELTDEAREKMRTGAFNSHKNRIF